MIDLKTKGYTVIPNFLTQEEIDIFLADYNKVRYNTFSNHPATVTRLSLDLPIQIFLKLSKVAKQSGLQVDLLLPGGLYTSTESMNMLCHQDHQSFYFNQQLYNYLNFYIILEKDDPMLSGLSVIPFDTLTNLAPNHVSTLINSGAKRFYPLGSVTRVFDDSNGDGWGLPVNIETIKESPKLSAGDLFLIRGDVIHKTQDASTKRIALSIRWADSFAPVSFEKIQQGCRYKIDWLSMYQERFSVTFNKVETVTCQEFYEKMFPESYTI